MLNDPRDRQGEEAVNILEQLKLDHENVARLMDILEGQLDRIGELKSADFDLIRDIMHYMTHYPDRVHHPMEDLVARKLVERDPAAGDIVSTLSSEHEGLGEKGQAFLVVASNVADGAMVLREALESKGRDYVAFLRNHMQMENEEFFPLAEKTLTKEDWNAVANAMEQKADPVFGPIVDMQYQELYAFIQQKGT
jgi:hemerythrin-like domain-containing protein